MADPIAAKPVVAPVLPQANPAQPVAEAAVDPKVDPKAVEATATVSSTDDDDTNKSGVPSSSSLSELPPTEKVTGTQFHTIGDPHEMTLDGEHYDNMRTGTFTKLKSKSGDFELQTRQTQVAPGITANDAAAVKIGNDVVSFDAKTNELFVNGEKKELKPGEELKLEGGTVKAGAQPGAFDITSAKGDKVQIQSMGGWMNVSGEISADRAEDEMEGTLGDLNGETAEAHMDKYAVKDGETLLDQNTGKAKGPGDDPIGGGEEPGPGGEVPNDLQGLVKLLLELVKKLGGGEEAPVDPVPPVDGEQPPVAAEPAPANPADGQGDGGAPIDAPEAEPEANDPAAAKARLAKLLQQLIKQLMDEIAKQEGHELPPAEPVKV